MGTVLLGILLILGGLQVCLHLPIPPIFLGLFAIVTGILLLVGK